MDHKIEEIIAFFDRMQEENPEQTKMISDLNEMLEQIENANQYQRIMRALESEPDDYIGYCF